MRRTRILFGAVMAALVATPGSALAEGPWLTGEQILENTELELGDIEYQNAVTTAVDVSTEPSETIDLNMESGDFNLQDNAFSLTFTSGDAHSSLQQSLLGQSFNRASAELANSQVRNAVSVDISAPDGVSGTVGFNAAAGAFNIQKNAAAIAVISGSMLAQSSAGIRQDAASNISLHHNVINDVTAVITLDTVSGNVGINLASGVGNVQLNRATTALSF